jgi:putative transposase
MPNYIRAKFEGGYYFFTVVTYRRMKLFNVESARRCLRKAIHKTQLQHPYETVAFCLLPDHLHCIWKLPEGDADFSIRWSSIKGLFSQDYLRNGDCRRKATHTRRRKGEVCIWQRRFWEHRIRDERDLYRHINYIHYNPVKHGWVQRVEDWSWSTYHRYLKDGFYGPVESFEDVINIDVADFGE